MSASYEEKLMTTLSKREINARAVARIIKNGSMGLRVIPKKLLQDAEEMLAANPEIMQEIMDED